MKFTYVLMSTVLVFFIGCAQSTKVQEGIPVKGQWIVESTGEVMVNPQTSGLKLWRNKLLTVSDGSADESQRLQLHIIDKNQVLARAGTVLVESQSLPISMSQNVAEGCFAGYLGDVPDLEAIAVDPLDDKIIYVVTEDATRSGSISEACSSRFDETGSTDYPTVLVRLVLQDDESLLMTHARPLQFAPEFNVGNHPNDGIEGLAITPNRTLYLGLEKDANDNARIFSTQISDEFWKTDGFIQVEDPELTLPSFTVGNHPINGMDYLPREGHKGYLIAAARNDDTLWVIDLEKQAPTQMSKLYFLAPSLSDDPSCEAWEVMDNSSLEGVAVDGDKLWLVNDPWKRHYKENIICSSNASRYGAYAPLLFEMSLADLGL